MSATVVSIPEYVDVTATSIILLSNGASKTINRVMNFPIGHRFQAHEVPEWPSYTPQWPSLHGRLIVEARADREDHRLYLFVE